MEARTACDTTAARWPSHASGPSTGPVSLSTVPERQRCPGPYRGVTFRIVIGVGLRDKEGLVKENRCQFSFPA